MTGLTGRKVLKLYGYGQHGRRTHVRIWHDGTKLLKPRNIARSGLVGWGKVQQEQKIKCTFGDCWWVTTPGHGGYILVASKPLPFDWPPVLRQDINENLTVYVYEFEEDCAWAVLLYNCPLALAQEEKRLKVQGSEKDFREQVVDTLQRWFPHKLRDEDKERVPRITDRLER